MATEEDLKKTEAEEAEDELPASHEPEEPGLVVGDAPSAAMQELGDEAMEPAHVAPTALTTAATVTASSPETFADEVALENVPVQLGYRRYVYAAYMAFALLAGFLLAKAGHAAWFRLGQWKPVLGEPMDEYVYPVAGMLGILAALYYWRKQEARQYADEVAEELSKVTWPSRKEVTSSTTVVVLTTVFATVFFALMDRFWSFVTDKIYTF